MKGQTERRRPTPEGAEHASGCLEDEITQALISLAFGRANDCVRLVLEPAPEVEHLDLRLLSEIKLVDRLRVLEQLAQMTGSAQNEAASFFRALESNCEEGDAE